MKLTADLHIHSHYSRATSKKLDFPNLAEMSECLEPTAGRLGACLF